MDSLFLIEPLFPPGFMYVPEFLTAEEELALYEAVKEIKLHAFNFMGYEAKRKVASFGYDYNFENKTLTKGEVIPVVFQPLLNKAANFLSIDKDAFAELLVTEYPTGSVINWHRDAFPFDKIVGISLMADCTFRLRPYDKLKQNKKSIISLPVKRRSLYLMKDAARTNWEHSTKAVDKTRYSITLRTLRNQT